MPPPVSARRSWLALALLCAVQFMVILDLSIVNVALPAIQRDVGFGSEAELQYVISLYALTFGGLLILCGRLADTLGRRRLLAGGLVTFAAGSLACAVSGSVPTLLGGRALQGIGSAIISPAALSLLTTLFTEDHERNRALGAWGAVGGAAGATGLVAGGLLTDALGWPWIFLINLPVAAVAVIAAPKLLPVGAATRRQRLDLPGAVALTGGLGALIFGLTQAEQHGFGALASIVELAFAVALLVTFVAVESRASDPLVAFRLLRLPGVTVANLVALVTTAIVASNLFFTTLYAQRVLGLSTLETGLAFLPNSVLVVVGSRVASKLAARHEATLVMAGGLGVIAVASLLMSGVSADGAYVRDVLPGFALMGLGLGLVFVTMTIAATRDVSSRDQGTAAGIINTAQQVGFAVGLATIAALATAHTGAASGSAAARLSAGFSLGYLTDGVLAALAATATLLFARLGHARGPTSPARASAGRR